MAKPALDIPRPNMATCLAPRIFERGPDIKPENMEVLIFFLYSKHTKNHIENQKMINDTDHELPCSD